MKRAFDVAVGYILLLMAVPLLIGIAGAVWYQMGRPVLFRQRRPGLREKPFTLYKFRSMRSGPARDAARLTSLGRFLRRTSLDELPSLFNVLRGDMSLVGPRPLLMRYLPYYTPRERERHTVRPGLTGWAQIHDHGRLSWNEKLELDAWYAEHYSMRLDFRILARTLPAALRRRSVVERPHLGFFDEERGDH